ncbi:hypothetical protein ACOX11_005440, partial [Escherichia coli]
WDNQLQTDGSANGRPSNERWAADLDGDGRCWQPHQRECTGVCGYYFSLSNRYYRQRRTAV